MRIQHPRFNRYRPTVAYADKVLFAKTSRDDNWLVPFRCLVHDRKIWDVEGKAKVSGRWKASDCFNRSISWRRMISEEPFRSPWAVGGMWYERSYMTPRITESDVDYLLSWQPLLQTYSEAELAQDAYTQFCDQFPAAIDFGNFLLESKDMANIIPKLENSPLKSLSGAHLQWAFGTSPTLGDLTTLSGIVGSIIKRVAWLKAHNGKRTKLRFRRTGLQSTPAIPPRIDLTVYTPYDREYDTIATLVSNDVEFTATCELHMNLQGLDGLEGLARAAFAALGMGNPAGIAYNAIPFSFVLDWVFKLGNFLDRHKLQPYIGEWRIDDFSHSLKIVRKWEVLTWYTRLDTFERTYTKVGEIVDETYDRSTAWPNDMPVFSFPPSAGQAILLASLIASL